MVMKNLITLLLISSIFILSGCKSNVEEQFAWENGGPKYIYVKVGKEKKLPLHMPFDEEMKCINCHKYDGVDAYTAATITLKKSKTGRLPQDEIKQAIMDALKGLGNYREIYVLSTSFNNKPLATCIELNLPLILRLLLSMPHLKNRRKSSFTLRQTPMYLWYM
jgi:hypothetical protein